MTQWDTNKPSKVHNHGNPVSGNHPALCHTDTISGRGYNYQGNSS